jgi:hypothetical protein
VLQGGAVGHQTTVDDELDVLAETHRVGLGFGEVGPELAETQLVALLQHNRIVLRL